MSKNKEKGVEYFQAIADEWQLPVVEVEDIDDRCYIVHHEGGYLSFWYATDGGIAFHFSLLCEVGQLFIHNFEEALKKYPNRVVELERKPWLIHQKTEKSNAEN